MIYTVTFNPSLDYIVTVDNFTCGAINRTKSEIIYPGGKGINVSIVLKNLGFENTALGFLAGFTGERVQQLLEEKGVATDFIRVSEGMSRINVKLRSVSAGTGGEKRVNSGELPMNGEKRVNSVELLMSGEKSVESGKLQMDEESSGKFPIREETEINGQGPAILEADIEKLYEKLDCLKAGDILVLAGSIPSVMPASMYMDIMRYLQGRDIKIIVDATKNLLKNVLAYHPFLIKPNNQELGELFGVELTAKDEVICYAKKLQEQGAGNVLVSMAGEGAVLVAEDGSVYQAGAPKGIVRNSVGAGDSMVAGFIAGYLEHGSYADAFKMGVCTGSASAFSEELATKEEVLGLLEEIEI